MKPDKCYPNSVYWVAGDVHVIGGGNGHVHIYKNLDKSEHIGLELDIIADGERNGGSFNRSGKFGQRIRGELVREGETGDFCGGDQVDEDGDCLGRGEPMDPNGEVAVRREGCEAARRSEGDCVRGIGVCCDQLFSFLRGPRYTI